MWTFLGQLVILFCVLISMTNSIRKMGDSPNPLTKPVDFIIDSAIIFIGGFYLSYLYRIWLVD